MVARLRAEASKKEAAVRARLEEERDEQIRVVIERLQVRLPCVCACVRARVCVFRCHA